MQFRVELSSINILTCHDITFTYFPPPESLHYEFPNQCSLVVGEGLETNTEHGVWSARLWGFTHTFFIQTFHQHFEEDVISIFTNKETKLQER